MGPPRWPLSSYCRIKVDVRNSRGRLLGARASRPLRYRHAGGTPALPATALSSGAPGALLAFLVTHKAGKPFWLDGERGSVQETARRPAGDAWLVVPAAAELRHPSRVQAGTDAIPGVTLRSP